MKRFFGLLNFGALRITLFPLLFLILVFLIFHSEVIFGGKTYTNLWIFKNHVPFKNLFPQIYNTLNQSSDLTTHYLPNKFFVMEALRKGIAPLWDPYVFCGFPLYANGSSAPFSPFNLLLLKFSPFETYAIQLLFIFLTGGTLFFFLLRKCFQLSPFSALCGAFIYIFCPFLMENIDFDTLLGFLWAFPAIIFLLEIGFKKCSPRYFVGLGFLLALTSYTTHMHVVLNALLLTGIYSLFKLLSFRGRPLGMTLNLCLAFLIFLGLSSISLLPFLEFLSHSQRNVADIENSRYLIPTDPWTSLYPVLLKIPRIHQIMEMVSKGKIELVGRGVYAGLFPFLAGISLAILAFKRKLEKRWFVFIAIFIFYYLSQILPIDKFIPLYNLWMPRFWMLFIFSAAILSAVALELLFQEKAQRHVIPAEAGIYLSSILTRLTKIILYTVILPVTFLSIVFTVLSTLFREKLLTILASFVLSHGRHSFIENQLQEFLNELYQLLSITSPFILVPLIFALLFLFVLQKRSLNPRPPVVAAFGMTLILFDLLSCGYLFRPKPVPAQDLFKTNPLISFLKNDRDLYRIATIQNPEFPMVLKPNLATLYGIHDIGGQESVIDRRYLEFAKTVLQNRPPAPLTHSEGILTFEQLNLKLAGLLNVKYILYTENHTPPQNVIPTKNVIPAKAGIELLFHSDGVKVYKNPYFLPRAFLAKGRGRATIQRYEPNQIDIDVEIPQNSYLILSDTYSPDWHATVDDRKTDVELAYGILRGVSIPKGRHHVKYQYKPRSLKLGLMISATTLTGLLLYLFLNVVACRKGSI